MSEPRIVAQAVDNRANGGTCYSLHEDGTCSASDFTDDRRSFSVRSLLRRVVLSPPLDLKWVVTTMEPHLHLEVLKKVGITDPKPWSL